MKKSFIWLWISLCLPITSALSQTDQASGTQTLTNREALSAGPRIYDTSRILFHRESIQRAGWTPEMIQTQMQPPENRGDVVWQSVVQAALLGNVELLRQSVKTLNQTLQKGLEEPPYFALTRILQAYDCMRALPEWQQVEASSRSALLQNLTNFFDEVYNTPTEAERSGQRIAAQTTRLLAGITLNSATHFAAGLNGSEQTPALHNAFLQNFEGEGWLKGAAVEEHLRLVDHLMPAAAALKNASSKAFADYQAHFQTPLDILVELGYPDGQVITAASKLNQAGKQRFAKVLERGLPLFAQPKYAFLLQQLYRDQRRPPEALLYGMERSSQVSAKGFSTVVYPRIGAAVLHTPHSPKSRAEERTQLSTFIDSGLSVREPAPALLGIELLTPQGRLSGRKAASGTAGHNTVVIDGRNHETFNATNEPKNGLVRHVQHFQNGQTFYDVFADGRLTNRAPYGGALVNVYQRSLYLDTPYLLDVFRVQGGTQHDYVYHSTGDSAKISLEQLNPFDGRDDSLKLLQEAENLQSAEGQGVYSITFSTPSGQSVRERLWVIDPVGSQVITGTINGQAFVVLRRASLQTGRPGAGNEGDVFTVLHEVFEGQAPSLTIQPLALIPQPNARGFQAQAFAVARESQIDVYLTATNAETRYETNFRDNTLAFQGYFGHLRLNDGQFASMRFIGQTMRYGTHGLEFADAQRRGTVRMVNPLGSSLLVDFVPPLPIGGAYKGGVFIHVPANRYPVMYQPLPVKTIENEETPQTLRLQSPVNLTAPESELAPPMTGGDSILLENHAELMKEDEKNTYSITATAPATVMVDEGDGYRQVLFSASVLRRLRGENVAGTIEFTVEPREFFGNPAPFKRVP